MNYKRAHQVSASHVKMGPRKVRVEIGVFLSKTRFGLQSGYFLTLARHMAIGRVVEAHRTFQDHTLNALSSLMALRYDGSNVGVVLLLHCFHAVSFPSNDRNTTTTPRGGPTPPPRHAQPLLLLSRSNPPTEGGGQKINCVKTVQQQYHPNIRTVVPQCHQ